MSEVLGLAGIEKTYNAGKPNEINVLRGADLEVRAGEVVALVAPSGSGKSTLLHIAGLLDTPTDGTVRLLGQDMASLGDGRRTEARRAQVGFVYQFHHLLPEFTALENIVLPQLANAVEREAAEARALELLATVGLDSRASHRPAELSGGEQQRVALARALAPRPRVMLMDEPFSGLDMRLRDDIRDQTLSVLKEEGTAVLLVTHEPDEAMRMADEILLMRDGGIVQRGAPYTVYNNPADRKAAAFFSDINILRGEVHGALTETPFGSFLAPGVPDGQEVEIVFRPQHLTIDFDRAGRGPNPTESHGMPARGVVERARFMGRESLVELKMDHDGQVLRATIPSVFLPKPGTVLWLTIRRDRCFLFPARTE